MALTRSQADDGKSPLLPPMHSPNDSSFCLAWGDICKMRRMRDVLCLSTGCSEGTWLLWDAGQMSGNRVELALLKKHLCPCDLNGFWVWVSVWVCAWVRPLLQAASEPKTKQQLPPGDRERPGNLEAQKTNVILKQKLLRYHSASGTNSHMGAF